MFFIILGLLQMLENGYNHKTLTPSETPKEKKSETLPVNDTCTNRSGKLQITFMSI